MLELTSQARSGPGEGIRRDAGALRAGMSPRSCGRCSGGVITLAAGLPPLEASYSSGDNAPKLNILPILGCFFPAVDTYRSHNGCVYLLLLI